MARGQVIGRYDAADVTVDVAGVRITGLGDDFVTFTKDEDFTTPTIGAQGDTTVNVNNNKLHTLTVKVLANCPQLSHLMQLAKEADFFPVWITNKQTGLRCGGNKAMLKTQPEVALGKEVGQMAFVFQVYDGAVNVK